MEGLEGLVGRRLKANSALSRLLCRYSDQPSVFYQLAPSDKLPHWEISPEAREKKRNCAAQYPRAVYDFGKVAEANRKSSGVLLVYTFCERRGTTPETLEPIIRDALKDTLVKPEASFPYCFAWARTSAFEMPGIEEGAKNRGVIGQEIQFDVIEYPKQETTDPDPIAALNQFLGKLYPEAVIVGLTHMEAFTEASAERPVIYCRLQGTETDGAMNTVVWMNARIAIHVICSDPETRLKLTADIQNQINWRGEMRMLDRSIMRPVRLSMNNTADYLKEGQLDGVFHYGVLRYRSKPHKITRVHMEIDPEAYIEDYARN